MPKNISKRIESTVVALASIAALSAQTYPYAPVPFTAVEVTDDFWSRRIDASRTTTIPLAFGKCEETGRYDNFVKAAHPDESNEAGGFPFDDTDVYKTIEGASYLLQTCHDKRLETYIDSVIAIVAAAQEPDGYLFTARTMNPAHPHRWAGAARWTQEEELSHELYNLGHMIDGAVAHHQATGKRNFLDIAIRYADCVCREIGTGEEQTLCVPGHEIASMALAKLYTVTGEKKYLDQAKLFLDWRGRTATRRTYNQTHLPVTQQDEAVGHAVRAGYLYAGMADVAALTGDTAYSNAVDRIWDNITGKKLYITGGIGSTAQGEAFGNDYELPNLTAYCETCAAIANVYVNHRLFLLHGDAKYYDVLERTLYNALIAGVSLGGNAFFYPNPLESHGNYHREPWFGCACCPSNICRFIPSIPGYIYATNDDGIYVNLFVDSHASLTLRGKAVEMEQQTAYPYDGDVSIRITKNNAGTFSLKIRIPGWAQNIVTPNNLYTYADTLLPAYTVRVNGTAVGDSLDKGYLTVSRKWRKGDIIDVSFDMPARLVHADTLVEADRGRAAVERGPLVYCAEWCDNPFNIASALLNQAPTFSVNEADGLLGGIRTITTDVQTLGYDSAGKITVNDAKLTLIPYYAWAHRGDGDMMVWIAQQPSAVVCEP